VQKIKLNFDIISSGHMKKQ